MVICVNHKECKFDCAHKVPHDKIQINFKGDICFCTKKSLCYATGASTWCVDENFIDHKTTDAIEGLEQLIDDLRNRKVVLVSMRSSREVIERPVSSCSGIFKEFEPANEYCVELVLARR